MTLLALGLILAAAVSHATWNLLAKRAGGGPAFVWLFGSLSSALYLPLAAGALWLSRPSLGWIEVGFLGGSALLHTGYFLLLQRGYAAGDLSLVYPLARGTGPLLATVAAIVLLGERPTGMALAGAGLVVLSVFVLAGGSRLLRRGPDARWAVRYGLLTGALIASYTLWDAYAVSALALPPLLVDWAQNFGRAGVLSPVALARRDQVRRLWRERRWEVVGTAVLSPLSYILVLTALSFTPVSYVAPAREVSILVGAVMGSALLAEGEAARRLTAALGIVAGVALLALG